MISEHTHMIFLISIYNLVDQMLKLYIWMTGKINTFQMTSLLQSFDTSSYFAFSTALTATENW